MLFRGVFFFSHGRKLFQSLTLAIFCLCVFWWKSASSICSIIFFSFLTRLPHITNWQIMLPVPSHFFPFHTQQAFPYHIPAVIAIKNIDLPYLCSPTLVPTITVSPGLFWLILAPLQSTKNPEEVLKPWINLYLTTYLISSVWERERKGEKERKKEEREREKK